MFQSFQRRPLAVLFSTLTTLTALTPTAAAQSRNGITNIRYELTYDATHARDTVVGVAMTFETAATDPVLLSLPAWTPGSYEISNFARNVRGFTPTQRGAPLRWDKSDPDTWRLWPVAAGVVKVEFRFLADSLDNAMAWARPDFLLVNGTNVFLHPEGIGLDFPATVSVRTEPGWRVVTGMHPAASPSTYREANYHDLVDMPFFIGRLDLDSVMVEGRPYRVASWPAGAMQGVVRQQLLDQIQDLMPPMAAVYGETPWDAYSVLLVFDSAYGGGSALEHQNSHVGIYNPGFMGTPLLASITAHEIIHGWNVKRLRPADLTPYRYDAPQPTTWLWVSEGITDYYADLALVRSGIVDSTVFLELLNEKLAEVQATPPVALEDASLSTWVHPTDGTAYVYYPKGGLAGFLLDVMIRDASNGQRSLDHAMRALYQRTWKAGRGFTADDFWGAVREAAGGRDFSDFNRRYIDGREPFPWTEVLPLAGLRLAADTVREPRIGVSTSTDSTGTRVLEVVSGSAAAEAGVQPGDVLVRVGEVPVTDVAFGIMFRARYSREREGAPLEIVVQRGGREQRLQGRLRFERRVVERIDLDPRAGLKAARVRAGLFRG